MKNCDIILPVFNAFDSLKKCLDSVFLYTDLKNNRLIIIDDKSDDNRIIPFIENFISKKEQNVIFIKNKNNSGFVKTVNQGMMFSNNDVLLLNSDTEVTNNWLHKLQNCAYSKINIATVTPLSNNATIASVPKFCSSNSLPDGYTLVKFQSLIDEISYKEYPEIPTGVGFCLYIKREALDTVGFFDEVSFESGYGEEEDFCYRCIKAGYRHLLCDDVIIYHAGSQSFLNKRQDVIDTRTNFLTQKYPEQKIVTDQFLLYNPLGYINRNISYGLCLNNANLNILVIIHGWSFDSGFVAGTGYHVYDLINSLKHKYNFHLLVPYSKERYRLYSYWKNEEEMLEFSISKTNYSNFYNNEYRNILLKIIAFFKINFIHIHHMFNHCFDIVDVAKEQNIPYMISLHDFYSVCPGINKIDYNDEYCGNNTKKSCNHCLQIKEIDIDIDIWRQLWALLFSNANKIIVPSESTKDEILIDFPDTQIDVIEHGIKTEINHEALTIDNAILFNIAFIGSITRIKGESLIKEMLNYIGENIIIHNFGNQITSSSLINSKLKMHGTYKREELGQLLHSNGIKLVCIFSICPETFSFVFFEAIANNIPVLAINLGNVGRKIKEHNLGWLIERDVKPDEAAKILKSIFTNKEEYKSVCESIKKYKIKTLDEMTSDYDRLYSTFPTCQHANKYEQQELKEYIKQCYLQNLNQTGPENQGQNITITSKKCALYFDTGKGYSEEETYKSSFAGNEVNISCSVPKNTVSIRFDPIKKSCCIVSDLKIYSNDKIVKHTPINGYENTNGEIIFIDSNPEIQIQEKVDHLNIKYHITILPDISNYKVLEKYISVSKERDLLQYIRDGLINERTTLTIERDGLINSRSWRITKPLRQIGVFVRRNKLLYLFAKGLLSLKKNGIIKTIKKAVNYFKSKNLTAHEVNTFLYESEYQENIDFSNNKPKVKAIAFYLPQFHSIPENDKWWGQGFTEWTNTRRAKPRFKGHYQPREPHKDIGYYNLTDIETIKWQAELAKQHGIYGFCFYLYWFSGKRLLEKPLDLFLEHSEININFCLCWANENWTRTWDGQESKLLIKQNYSDDDSKRFIEDIKKYITDKRYIKIQGVPIILVYNPGNIPNVRETFLKWKDHANVTGIGEISIWICKTFGHTAKTLFIEDIVGGVVDFPPHSIPPIGAKDIYLAKKTANIYDYKELVSEIKKGFVLKNDIHKSEMVPFYYTCMMDWDNSARKKNGWSTFSGFSLKSFFNWVSLLVTKSQEMIPEPVIFINAWNEWAEGTYLEPDKKYGYANINTISKALCGLPFNDKYYNDIDKEFFQKGKVKLCVQIHLYYLNLTDEIINNLNCIPFPFHCYISTDSDEKVEIIRSRFDKECKTADKIYVAKFDNRGRDVGPFIMQMKDHIDKYDYILHIHSKKSFESNGYGDDWRQYLYRHLLGSTENVYSIFNEFFLDKNIGLIFPEAYPPVIPQMIWGTDIYQAKKNVVNFLKRMNITTVLGAKPEFPAGNMFWARTKSIKKVFDANITHDDFPVESNQKDMTLAHSIERAWVYLVKNEGYTFKQVSNVSQML